MPRAYDLQPLPFDRDPLRDILGGIPKMPPIDFAAIQEAGIVWFNLMFGDLIDTSAWDDAKAKWDNLMSQIGSLFTLVNSGPVSAAQWAVWWSNTLIALGYESTSAATIANWLSGNYDAAKTAKANWDTFLTAMGLNPTQIAAAITKATQDWEDFMAAWGVGDPADVAAAVAANKQKWVDLLASFGVGTPADVGAATAASKARWDSFLASVGLGSATAAGAQLAANQQKWTDFLSTLGIGTSAAAAAVVAANQQKWTDFLASIGVGTGTAAGTAVTDSTAKWNAFLASIGLGSATAAGAQLAGNNTTIGGHTTSIATQLGWWQRLPENILISLDGMHIFYPLGSPSDTPTTTSGGKRTWYAAKADMAVLQGQANSTSTPTVTFTDIGTVTQANTAAANTAGSNASLAIATNQALNDAIVQASSGGAPSGTTASDALSALTNIPYSNIVGQYGANPVFGAMGGGNSYNGLTSPWPTISWTHTPVAADTMVVVFVEGTATSSSTDGSTLVCDATWGGTAMTPIGPTIVTGAKDGGGWFGVAQAFYVKIPAGSTTTKTVTATLEGYTSSGLRGNSYSCSAAKIADYSHTISVGTSSPISMSVSSDEHRLVLGFFGGLNMGTWSGFNRTSRYNAAPAASGYGNGCSCVFGDYTPSSGATTASFQAAHPTTGQPFSNTQQFLGMIVQLSN